MKVTFSLDERWRLCENVFNQPMPRQQIPHQTYPLASFFLHPPLELKVAAMMTVSALDSVELPGRFKRVSFFLNLSERGSSSPKRRGTTSTLKHVFEMT